MKHEFFQSIENCSDGTRFDLDEIIEQLAFNGQGLIPVITKDAETKEVLMMAWMNKQSLSETLQTGRMAYWSRSRQALWIKGETSGNTQSLVQLNFDCDGDAILCMVEQHGPACHTGRPNCFYLKANGQERSVSIQGNSQTNSNS